MVDAPTQPPSTEIKNLTDMGNSERFIEQHGDKILYCPPWKKWLVWDGTRWKEDGTGVIKRMAKRTVRRIPDEVEHAASDKQREAIIKHAHRSESANKLDNMIQLAQSEESVVTQPEEFDHDPFLLNTPNCMIDLKAWKVGKHNPKYRLMKRVGALYDPHAESPVWDAFLYKIMGGNENLLKFLQRAVGYGMTGSTKEQVVFFLHGKGSNGKSTFLEALRFVLADYAMNTPTSTIMRTESTSTANNDVARLRGARLVTAVETEENQRLAESTIKAITGGDSITARYLYSEFFEFKPEFKLFLACNHKPVITGVDNGIWRRIRLIPFSVILSDEEKDIHLPDKLQKEASGILNWMLEGCRMWQEEGLGNPDEIIAAISEYRGEMDSLAQFFADCCVIVPNAKVQATKLYEVFQRWSAAAGERSRTQRDFGSKMSERGFTSLKGTGGLMFWQGIGLREVEKVE